MPHLFVEIILVLGLLAAVFFALVRYLESVSLFYPNRRMHVDPSIMGFQWEDVYFETSDHVKLNGWFFKNPHAKTTLIFAHGNAGNISDRLFKVRFFYDLGLNVFIFDYRGYGNSEGKPSEKGIYLDARAAYDYLQARGGVDMSRMVLFGASLGGAVVIDLACHRKAAMLVVESTFTNAADMAHIHYPFVPALFLNLKLDSINKVKNLDLPKLFIHSPDDAVVPFWIGQKLYAAAREPKEFLKIHGSHNDGSVTTDAAAAGELIRVLKAEDLL